MIRIPPKCHLLYKYYRHILVAAFIATVFGTYFTLKLSLESDLAELLPDSFESVKALNRMKEEVGGVGQLRIIFESDSFAAIQRLERDLEPKLLASPYVNYVDYRNDIDFYKKNALLFLSQAGLDSLRDAIETTIAEEKQKLNPLFVDDLFGDEDSDTAGDDGSGGLEKWGDEYKDQERDEFYTNSDSTVLVMKIFASQTNSNIPFIRSMLDEVERIVHSMDLDSYDPNLKMYYGGNFKNRLDEFEVVRKDILGTAMYGIGGVFLLIVLYFRRLLGAILITVSLLFALCWTFGLTYLVIGQLNTLTGFLFVILFGLGIDYGIHTFARYVESRKAGLDSQPAMEKVVCGTGSALATTAITTSAAFFSLTIMDFKGFSDLGFIAGVGMLFALVAMVMVLPAFIVLFENLGLLKIKPAPSYETTVKGRTLRFSRPILLVAVPLTLIASYYFTQVGFEYDFTNLRAITKERAIVSEKTAGVFKLSESPAVILADSRQDTQEIMAEVERIIREDTLSPTVKTVRSVFSLVPDDQQEKLAKIREIRKLVDEEADGIGEGDNKERIDELKSYLQVDEPFTWDEFPAKDKRQFINKRGEVGNFVFIYPSVPLRDGRNAIDFRNDIGKITTASGKVFYAASSNIISAEMLLIIIREGKLAVVLTVLVVFAVVVIDFRSFKAALLVLSPLAVGVLWMGGVMYLTGMKLNFFNIVVIPSVIGIGVDNGVHIYHRYLEEGPGSLRLILRNTGLAITMTTLTTIVGYSGLILASHPGLNSLGNLAVIGIAATFIAAVVVLPALLQFFENGTKTA
ncbi:MAG: RND family transporter [Gemmatimonadales bacterium]